MAQAKEAVIEKYARATRILHQIHMVAFCVLFLTGLILFIPQLAFLAAGSWTRIIHRVAAVAFIMAPLIYLILKPKAAFQGIARAFVWGKKDLEWLKAAPRYYFLSDEQAMPPQGEMNTGQKLWWFIVVVFGAAFIVTGIVMLLLKNITPAPLFQWMVFFHDVSFIVSGAMLFVHIYLAVVHPMMTEAWRSITKGVVSVEYAKSHHGLWYDEKIKQSSENRQ
jgi:formate dehydrogenase subunit gamma